MDIKFKLLVTLIALAGLTWQITEITEDFMKYESVNELTIEAARYLPVPSITLCAFLPALANESKVHQLMKRKKLSTDRLRPNKYGMTNLRSVLTPLEHFQVTPEAKELLMRARYRIPNAYRIFNCSSDCLKMITAHRFMYLYYMCYRYSQNFSAIIQVEPRATAHNKNTAFSFFRITHSLVNPKLQLQIDLDHRQLKNASYLGIHCADADIIPYTMISHYWSVFQYPFGFVYGRKNKEPQNVHYTSYKFTKTSLLPSPYDSRCINYSRVTRGRLSNSHECMDTCVQDMGADELGMILTATIVHDPESEWNKNMLNYKLPFFTETEAKNVSIQRKYREIFRRCVKKCSNQDCSDWRFFTIYNKGESKKLSNTFTIKMYVPDTTVAFSNFIPKINLTTYIIYILNCFSFWLGLSVFSLHTIPVRVIGLYKCYKRSGNNKHLSYEGAKLRVEVQNVNRKVARTRTSGSRGSIKCPVSGKVKVKSKITQKWQIGQGKLSIVPSEIAEEGHNSRSKLARRVRKRPPFDALRLPSSYYPQE